MSNGASQSQKQREKSTSWHLFTTNFCRKAIQYLFLFNTSAFPRAVIDIVVVLLWTYLLPLCQVTLPFMKDFKTTVLFVSKTLKHLRCNSVVTNWSENQFPECFCLGWGRRGKIEFSISYFGNSYYSSARDRCFRSPKLQNTERSSDAFSR